MNPGRHVARVIDSVPVVILATIAGAGSFVHIRDTAAQHGQRGPMAWAIAVCIDLTCVMAARERQRDKRTGRASRRLSWPTIVLSGGVLLSLAANLAQAQRTDWGRITAATPCGAFLVPVSMLERRSGAARPAPAPGTEPAGQDDPAPAVPPVRDEDGPAVPVPAISSAPAEPSPGRPPGALLGFARRVAAEHEQARGRPITRDALRVRLGVSNQLASDLLHQIRTTSETTRTETP